MSSQFLNHYSFIQQAFTEYLIHARIEPGDKYIEVIPTLGKFRAQYTMGNHKGFEKKKKDR